MLRFHLIDHLSAIRALTQHRRPPAIRTDEKIDVTWVVRRAARSGGLLQSDAVAHGFELTDGVAARFLRVEEGEVVTTEVVVGGVGGGDVKRPGNPGGVSLLHRQAVVLQPGDVNLEGSREGAVALSLEL